MPGQYHNAMVAPIVKYKHAWILVTVMNSNQVGTRHDIVHVRAFVGKDVMLSVCVKQHACVALVLIYTWN